MRKLSLIILVLVSNIIYSQKMQTRTGVVTFDGSVPSFEPVKAKNNQTTCVFNADSGQIASLILVKEFKFKTALMEEHFNENYVESTKFPKAILKGKLENFDVKLLTEKEKTYILKGSITFHGVKRNIEVKVNASKVNNFVKLNSEFFLNASDFDISIPSFVKSKLTNEIKVNVDFAVQ